MNNILITKREFLNEAINGPLLNVDTANNTPFLQANAEEFGGLRTTVQLSTTVDAAVDNPYLYTDLPPLSSGNASFYNSNVDWAIQGFSAGDSIRIGANASTIEETVLSVQGQTMIVTNSGDITATLTIVSGVYRGDFTFIILTTPTALRYFYGIIPNQDPTSFLSPLDGQQQSYSSGTITGVFSPLVYNGTPSSNVGTVQARLTSSIDGINTFELEHNFIILPYFIETYLTNFQNSTTPNDFDGVNTFKYVNQFSIGTNINNPNSGKKFNDDSLNGSVGWRNQNFSGLTSVYSVQNVVLEDSVTFTSLSTLEATISNNVKIQVKKLSGNFALGQKVIIYHSKLPNSLEYSNQPDTFGVVWIKDSLEQIEGAVEVDSNIIQHLTVDINGGDSSLIDIEFDIIYDSDEESLINQNSSFELAVGVWDGTLNAENSDRSIETILSDTWTKNPDVTGLIFENELKYYRSNEIISINDPTGDFPSWVQSIWTCEGTFKVLKSAFFDTEVVDLRHVVVAYKELTDEWFLVDQYVFNTSSVPVEKSGVPFQQSSYISTRDLGVPSTDQISKVSYSTFAPFVFEPEQLFSTQHGFVINFRDWEMLNDVPGEFYNALLPHNGMNKKTSNYSDKNDYQIFGFLIANIKTTPQGDNLKDPSPSITEYIMKSGLSEQFDFDEDGNAPIEWTGEIEIYNQNNQLIDSIDSSQDNRIKGIFRNSNIGVTINISDAFGELRIGPNGGLTEDYRLSTIGKDWESLDNILKPLIAETHVKITQNNGLKEIYLEALIEKDNLSGQNILYNISAELIELSVVIPVDGRITEDDQARFTEDDQQRIIE